LPAASEKPPTPTAQTPAMLRINELPVRVAEQPAAATQHPVVKGQAAFEEPSAVLEEPSVRVVETLMSVVALPEEDLPAVIEDLPAADTQLHAEEVPAVIEEPCAPVLPWPESPGTGNGHLSAAALATFFAKLLTPGSVYYSAEEPGISRKRMPTLLPDHLSEHGRTLMVWLDAAGLLVPPANPAQPWARPRQLTTEALGEIASRLALVPFPTGDDLVLAKKQGMR
jgi:hypothetical protein